ncbi:hypothetical protein [Xanthobacter variabilis]|uniref:hypothetical protein n=1 Tax=Xanthobacter variabilis TaxID=3119932 RepID=UPI00374E91BB
MKKPLVIGIVAVLALGIGGYAGVQYWAQKKAYAVIDNALAQVRATGAKASVGSSAVSLKDRSLTLGDLSVTSADGAVSLTVAQFSAHGVGAPTKDGRITADSIVLENLTLTRTDGADGPRVVETLPHVAIERFAGPLVVTPTAGNAADMVNANPVVLALRQLASVDAARIDVPHAVTRVTPGKANPLQLNARELTLDGIAATDVRSGKVARLSVARLLSEGQPADGAAQAAANAAAKATGAGADGAKGNDEPANPALAEGSGLPRVQAVAIVARDIDITPLLAPSADSDGALRAVLGALETGAFNIEQQDDVRTEGAGMTLTAVSLRPAAITAARLAALEALAADEPPTDPAPLLKDATDLLKGLAFTAFEVRDMRTVEPVGGGRAALFALKAFDAGTLAELRFEGVDGDSDGQAVKFGTISVTGLDLPRLLTIAHADDPTQPDVALSGFRALTGVTATDIEVPVEGSDDTPAEPVTIARASLTWGAFPDPAAGELPGRILFELKDVNGPIDAEDGEPFNTLAAAGLKRATFSMALGAAYDAGTQSISVGPADVEVKDAFRTGFSARLDNLPAAAFASEQAFTGALPGVNIGPISVTISDHGLANLVLQRLADADGQGLEEYRAHLLDLLNEGIAAVAPGAPETAAVAEAIAQFIRDPKTLEITATPKGRVPFLAFLNSDDPTEPLQLFSFSAVNKP